MRHGAILRAFAEMNRPFSIRVDHPHDQLLPWVHIPTTVAETPAPGATMRNLYWAWHPERGLVFLRSPRRTLQYYFPLCAADPETVSRAADRLWTGYSVTHLPVAYLESIRPAVESKCR